MAEELTKDSVQIARLEERMATMTRDMLALTEQVGVMNTRLDSVLTTLSEAKGGWRLMMLVGGGAAAFGGTIATFFVGKGHP